MKKISNDQNLENLRKRKLLRYAMIALYIMAIVVAFIDLFVGNWFLLGGALVLFLMATQVNNKRNSIEINKRDDMADNDESKLIDKEREKIKKRNQKKK